MIITIPRYGIFQYTPQGWCFFSSYIPSAHVPRVNHIYPLNRSKNIPLQHQSQTSDAKCSVCKIPAWKNLLIFGGREFQYIPPRGIVLLQYINFLLNTYKADDLFSSEHVAGDSCAGDSGAGLMVGKNFVSKKMLKVRASSANVVNILSILTLFEFIFSGRGHFSMNGMCITHKEPERALEME